MADTGLTNRAMYQHRPVPATERTVENGRLAVRIIEYPGGPDRLVILEPHGLAVRMPHGPVTADDVASRLVISGLVTLVDLDTFADMISLELDPA